jgi:Lrp/AsnC family transcriptional regulator for asnA, asnC and gidA
MGNNGQTRTSFEVDTTDLAIVEKLRKDGRVAFAQMAKELGVSPGMIRARYNHLIESGYLKIMAITNPLQMGFETMAMIGIRVDGNKLLDVANRISEFNEVIYLVITSGSYDILAEIRAQDQAHLLNFLTEKLYKIDGVRESDSFLHLKIVKEIYY